MTDIAFDEAIHEYRVGGVKVPHVTYILRDLVDLSKVPEAILLYAQQRGTATHRAVELWHAGTLDYESLDAPVRARFISYQTFLNESGFEVIECETKVFHPELRYAGKMDLYGRFPGRRDALIDIKTGIVEPVAGPQTAAYREAFAFDYPPARLADRYALWLGESSYRLEPLTNPRDWPNFHNRMIEWKRQNSLK